MRGRECVSLSLFLSLPLSLSLQHESPGLDEKEWHQAYLQWERNETSNSDAAAGTTGSFYLEEVEEEWQGDDADTTIMIQQVKSIL